MACDMPELGEFPPLDSRQKRFLWVHKKLDLAPHPVFGHVLRAGDAEKFPQALGLKSLDPFLRVSKQGPCLTAIEEDGDNGRRVQLGLSARGRGDLNYCVDKVKTESDHNETHIEEYEG